MLRAVRLEQRLGFAIESRTLELLKNATSLLEGVSGERIRGDLGAVFNEERFAAIMERLHQLGLLTAIHPALDWNEWLAERVSAAQRWQPDPEWKLADTIQREQLMYALWLYRVPDEDLEAVADRFHFGKADRSIILRGGRFACDLNSDPKPSTVVGCLEGFSEGALVATWIADDRGQELIQRYLTEWRWVKPHTNGEALREQSIPFCEVACSII